MLIHQLKKKQFFIFQATAKQWQPNSECGDNKAAIAERTATGRTERERAQMEETKTQTRSETSTDDFIACIIECV